MAHSKAVKRAATLAIDGVRTKRIFFAPMIARKLTLEECASYENLTAEKFQDLRDNPEEIDLFNQDLAFHTSKKLYDETTHVKVRLLFSQPCPVDFSSRKVS